MGEQYNQLRTEQRLIIYWLRKHGETMREIADFLGVHKSTVSREIRRNSGGRGYRPKQADKLALARRSVSHPRYTAGHWSTVDTLLEFDLSPDQINNRLAYENALSPSPTAIYDHVFCDRVAGGGLHKHLRCRKKRRRKYGSQSRRGTIPGRTSIDARPKVVDTRSRFGDIELDLVEGGGHECAIVTMTDRKSRYMMLEHVQSKQASEVSEAILRRLMPHRDLIHTLTNDNGKEFAYHALIARKLKAKVYFCDPHAPWQRGTCENQNGLLRQYFPKKQSLRNVSKEALSLAEYKLAHRPRKCLGWKTPYEVKYNTITNILDVALRT